MSTPPAGSLRIDGELTIYRAAELKPWLLQGIEASPRPEVDLSGVTDIDTAGLQLLILAKRQARALGREATFVRHSPPVLEVLALTGLAGWFGDVLVEDTSAEGAPR